MKKLTLAAALGLAMILPLAAHAAVSSPKAAVERLEAAKAKGQSVACSMCFTCGGSWPVFAGNIPVPGASPNERGGSCADPLMPRPDNTPELCCRKLSK